MSGDGFFFFSFSKNLDSEMPKGWSLGQGSLPQTPIQEQCPQNLVCCREHIAGTRVIKPPEQPRCSGRSPGTGDPNISARTGVNQSIGKLPGGLGCSCWLSEPSLTAFAGGWVHTQPLLAAAGAHTPTKTFATLCLVFKMGLSVSWRTAIQLVTRAPQGTLAGQLGQPVVWDLFSWKLL